MTSPAFSICLLAHNSERYIGAAIESVLAQTVSGWEMVVCDDASSDATGEVVNPYLRDPRIRYVRHEKNLRQSQNWRYAIEHTTAPLVATLHADDAWEPETLAHYGAALSTAGEADIVWGRWVRTNQELKPLAYQLPPVEDQRFSGIEAFTYLFRGWHCLPSVMAFRRSLVERGGLPDPNFDALCDVDFILRLCKQARFARALKTVLARYRLHDESLTTAYHQKDRFVQELDKFQLTLPTLLNGVPMREKLRAENDVRISEWNFGVAMGLKVEGQHETAKQRLKTALRLNRRLLTRWKFLVKWTLFHSGRLGARLLARIHGSNSWVTKEAA
jgi:GT2 family glycosyltransferase